MAKISDWTTITGAAVDAAADVVPIIDDTESGTARNKKITVAELKVSLGLGALSDQGTVNNADWSGTDLAVANGGTGASTAAVARTNLDIYSKSEVDGIAASGGASEATASEIWTGSATNKYISPDKMFDAAAPVALTSTAGSVAVDMATGINFNVDHDENTTIANPSNAKLGQSGRILVVQDAGGGNTLAWGSNWTPVGGPFTIDTAADAENVFAYFVNTTSDIEYSYVGVKG